MGAADGGGQSWQGLAGPVCSAGMPPRAGGEAGFRGFKGILKQNFLGNKAEEPGRVKRGHKKAPGAAGGDRRVVLWGTRLRQ